MTQPRIWTDAEAERRFWALMSRYEQVRPPAASVPRLLASLSLAGLRDRLAILRSRRIEAQAQALVDRYTVAAAQPAAAPLGVAAAISRPAPAAEPVPATAPASSRTRSALLIAATLANDDGTRAATATERAAPQG